METQINDPQVLFDHFATHFISKGLNATDCKVKTVKRNKTLVDDMQDAVDMALYNVRWSKNETHYLRSLVSALTNVAETHDLHFDPEDLGGYD